MKVGRNSRKKHRDSLSCTKDAKKPPNNETVVTPAEEPKKWQEQERLDRLVWGGQNRPKYGTNCEATHARQMAPSGGV